MDVYYNTDSKHIDRSNTTGEIWRLAVARQQRHVLQRRNPPKKNEQLNMLYMHIITHAIGIKFVPIGCQLTVAPTQRYIHIYDKELHVVITIIMIIKA